MSLSVLRQQVLQLAMQGKLVPQDSSDEPASVLLERIRSEQKGRFGKKFDDFCVYKNADGNYIEKAKGKEMDVTEKIPYDIPESWAWCKIEFITYKVGNKDNQILARDIKESGKVPVISQSQSYIDGYTDEAERQISDVPLVLFGDHTRIVKYIDVPFVIGADGTKLLKPVCVEPRFLYYSVRFAAENISSRGYARHWSLLADALLPLPPLAEQRRIVDEVDRIFSLIDIIEHNQDELSKSVAKLRGKILDIAMQGKLVPQDSSDEPASVLFGEIKREQHEKLGKNYDDSYIFKGADEDFYEKLGNVEHNISNSLPFELPAGWEWTRLSSLCEILNGDRGKNYPAKSKLSNKGIPFISALNLDGEKVVVDSDLMCLTEEQFNVLRAGKLCKDDIVVCIRGSIGKHARYQFDRGAIASSLVILRPFHKSEALASFIMSYLDSPLFYTELDKYINGSAQPNLSARNFGQFLVPLPPLAEQRRIVEAVGKAFVQVDALEAAIKNSDLA